MAYSTIKIKTGICDLCTDGKEKPLTKGLCGNHYWQSVRMKSAIKQEEKAIGKDPDLSTLVGDLDIVYSRYIRLKDADLYGMNTCISCGKRDNWKNLQCGHFIPRAHMYTRFSELNTAPQCVNCNEHRRGNLAGYAKALELIRPGSIDILHEHANIVYKYSKEELKSMIADYTKKLKKLMA